MRTITEGDTVLFCSSDIAKAFGYDKPANAVAIHCSSTLKRGITTESKNRYGSFTRQMEMTFIPESDLYRLITHSKLPDANISPIIAPTEVPANNPIVTIGGIPLL